MGAVHQYPIADIIQLRLCMLQHRGEIGVHLHITFDLPGEAAFDVLIDHIVLAEVIKFEQHLFCVHIIDVVPAPEVDLFGIAAIEMGPCSDLPFGYFHIQGVEVRIAGWPAYGHWKRHSLPRAAGTLSYRSLW